MSHVYVVVATRDSEIEACESFAGVQSALGRGFQLASDKAGHGRTDLFQAAPKEEVLLDGSLRWVFMDTNKQSVVVFYRKIEEAMLSSKDPASIIMPAIDPKYPAASPLSLPMLDDGLEQAATEAYKAYDTFMKNAKPYDFMDRSLPVGWKLNGQPATMGDMMDSPFDVKDPLWDLTDTQKWAVVTSRVRKSPNHRSIPKGYSGSTSDQATSLDELKSRTQFGEQIRDGEIDGLHALREDLIAGVNHA